MKKQYKVITDNLDWLGIVKNVHAVEVEDGFLGKAYLYVIGIEGSRTEEKGLWRCVKDHPDWFQEITDAPKEYTKDDVIDFALFYNRHQGSVKFWGADLFDNWLKTRKV